jgi:hypothetical protein
VAFFRVGDSVMLVYDRAQKPLEILDWDSREAMVQIYQAQYSYGGAGEDSILLDRQTAVETTVVPIVPEEEAPQPERLEETA